MELRIIIFSIFFIKLAASLPTGVHLGKDGTVGASFGGYSASAGLGGIIGDSKAKGKLHAEAGTPNGHYAGAGLGGFVSENAGAQGELFSAAGKADPGFVVAPALNEVVPAEVAPPTASVAASSNAQASASGSSSSSASSSAQTNVNVFVTQKPKGSFFDGIFQIPISTLGAVNQYLNNRKKVFHVNSPTAEIHRKQLSSANSASAASIVGSSSSASSSTGIGGGGGVVYKTAPNYNDIFNIPISVLDSVNSFLNG